VLKAQDMKRPSCAAGAHLAHLRDTLSKAQPLPITNLAKSIFPTQLQKPVPTSTLLLTPFPKLFILNLELCLLHE
jgi:hypothetical protein